jgi:hypothetical protein
MASYGEVSRSGVMGAEPRAVQRELNEKGAQQKAAKNDEVTGCDLWCGSVAQR